MDSNSDSTENLDSILFESLSQLQSSNEDINKTINGTRITYNFDPSLTFPETDIPTSICFIGQIFSNKDFINIYIDDINVVIDYLKGSFNRIESNNTEYLSTNNDKQSEIIELSEKSLPITRTHTETLSNAPIALSNSVAITTAKPSKQLQLVYPLENIYRPRYKSDYFPQTGIVRRPRYIADNASNHIITLQLPTDYQYDLENDYIRIALITTFIDGHGHYYSPYKFQTDHNDIKVPDENPIYISVDTSPEDNFIMRLQLVLIKSKLDQLNYVQPLQPFVDTTTHIRNIIHEERLSPKDLITKYQLDKSCLAFTLCTKLSDGSYKIYPETTVISSIITEASTSKKPTEPTPSSSADPTPNTCCPHCSHRFDPDAPSGSEQNKKRKSKSHSCSKKTSGKNSNKKKKNA